MSAEAVVVLVLQDVVVGVSGLLLCSVAVVFRTILITGAGTVAMSS
jgi:hypothetical protein